MSTSFQYSHTIQVYRVILLLEKNTTKGYENANIQLFFLRVVQVKQVKQGRGGLLYYKYDLINKT